MLIDSRDHLDAEGWPVIATRDRLPLVWLLKGAALTDSFTRQIKSCGYSRQEIRRAYELQQSRDAVAYALTLPAWWHSCPVRKHVCSHTRPTWRYESGG